MTRTFLEKDRLDGDLVDGGALAKVVDQTGDAQQIERTEVGILGPSKLRREGWAGLGCRRLAHGAAARDRRALAAHPSWVIVVAVDGEARDANVQVGVLVIDVAKAVEGVAHIPAGVSAPGPPLGFRRCATVACPRAPV